MFLLVSCLTLAFQLIALARMARQQATAPAEKLVGKGYTRTVACRVLAATVYVVVAAVQLAGSGTLSAEALIIWTAIQALWVSNSIADIRIRRSLSQSGARGRHAG
jgi:hypothetical protein